MKSRDSEHKVAAVMAEDVPPQTPKSTYPEEFARKVGGRVKKRLGDAFGLTRYGVNLTRLPPGAMSALRHSHAVQDEFVYILEGSPTLITNAGRTLLRPGMCAGFRFGTGDAHHLKNDSDSDVVYLEIGDRTSPEQVIYADDDLAIVKSPDGVRRFARKDGTSF